MMKKLAPLLFLVVLILTGCSALPSEERAFAVVLGLDHADGRWQVYARIPTYQQGGGYATVQGSGATLASALTDLDAQSPMRLHHGQLRMVVFSRNVASSGLLPEAVTTLAERPHVRLAAHCAITEADMPALMDALKPASGSRLSKSVDVLVEARKEQGIVLPSTLADAALLMQRRSPVMMNMTLRNGAADFSGCWPISLEGRATQLLDASATQVLSLLRGDYTSGPLMITGDTVTLVSASAATKLVSPELIAAEVRLKLHLASHLPSGELAEKVGAACVRVARQLSLMGCDALGLSEQAMRPCSDLAAWRRLDWPSRMQEIAWRVTVSVRGGT